MKHLILTCLFYCCLISSNSLAQQGYNSAVILQYHHVSDTTPAITSVTPQQFAEHMAYLKQHQYKVVPLPELIQAIKARLPIADKTVAITFDDGYANVYQHARPILHQYQWPYTVFVNSKFIDEKHSHYMSWPQLKTLIQQGATIANHSHQHDYLVRLSSELAPQQWQQQMRHDIRHTEQRIKTELGHNYRYLAYPYGEFNQPLMDILAELDFVGIGQHSGAVGHYSNLLRLPRFPASGKYADLKRLKVKLQTLNMPILALSQADPLIAESAAGTPPQLKLRLELTDIHPHQVQCFNSATGGVTLSWQQNQLTITGEQALPTGRSRYNCTAPSKGNPKRYYWFSQPWLRLPKIKQLTHQQH